MDSSIPSAEVLADLRAAIETLEARKARLHDSGAYSQETRANG